jgi:hypothetical protein
MIHAVKKVTARGYADNSGTEERPSPFRCVQLDVVDEQGVEVCIVLISNGHGVGPYAAMVDAMVAMFDDGEYGG